MMEILLPIAQRYSPNVEYRTSSPSNGFKSLKPLEGWWGKPNTDVR